jgi:hypothetical protein
MDSKILLIAVYQFMIMFGLYLSIKIIFYSTDSNDKDKNEVFPNNDKKPPVIPEWETSTYTSKQRKKLFKNE